MIALHGGIHVACVRLPCAKDETHPSPRGGAQDCQQAGVKDCCWSERPPAHVECSLSHALLEIIGHARRPPRGVVLDTVLDERGLRRLAVLQTCKRLCKLAESLHGMGHKIDRTLVGELLHKLDYSL